MMILPISVLVTRISGRSRFCESFCIPSVEANLPSEILNDFGGDSVQCKRNRLLGKAKNEYVFHCDDDLVLARHCLRSLLDALDRNPAAGYSYCDNMAIRLPGIVDRCGGVWDVVQQRFDIEILKKRNLVPTASLWRRDAHPGWDERLYKFQDWDVALSAAKVGVSGIYVPEKLYHAYYLDRGITDFCPSETSGIILKKKHGL